MTTRHRIAIAAYVTAERHLTLDRRGAKTLTQIADEVGTHPNTVRRWLRRDHAVSERCCGKPRSGTRRGYCVRIARLMSFS